MLETVGANALIIIGPEILRLQTNRVAKVLGGLHEALRGTDLKQQAAQRQMLPDVGGPGPIESLASRLGFIPHTESFRVDLADKEQSGTGLEQFFHLVQDNQSTPPSGGF